MTTNSRDILKQASVEVEKMFNGEKFVVAALRLRAKKAAENHPNDQTLRMMYSVLDKMDSHEKTLITRAELRDIYGKFASSNTMAAGYFEKELALESNKSNVKIMQYSEDSSKDIVKEAMSDAADKSILNGLENLWDDRGKLNKNSEHKVYNPEHAKKANLLTEMTLSKMGCAPHKVNTFAGSENFILCTATYQTPKGDANLVVPVQIAKAGLLMPTMFASNYGIVELSKESVQSYVRNTAGESMFVKAEKLLDVLSGVKKLAAMNDMELQVAIAKNSANKVSGMVKEANSDNSLELTSNPIFVSSIDPQESTSVQLPQTEDMKSFAAEMSTPSGAAEYMFGKQAVNSGKSVIYNRFKSFGTEPQIAVANCDDDSIIYAVKLATSNGPVGFHVIAEVTNGRVNMPQIIAANDKVYEFSRDGVEQAIQHRAYDKTAIAKVSPMYGLKPSEIMDRLRVAADNKDYKTAEDALNVLSEVADKEMVSLAMSEYMRSISGEIKKEASNKCGCSMIVRNANHSGPICGHLNLPLDKVYQDEHGDCRPLYRKNMSDMYEGVLFSTSKIFL